MIVAGPRPSIYRPQGGRIAVPRDFESVDLASDPLTILSTFGDEGVTLATGISNWKDMLRPTLAWEMGVGGNQPGYSNNRAQFNGSAYMTLNAAGIAALNAYGGNHISIVVACAGDTANSGDICDYISLANDSSGNHLLHYQRAATTLILSCFERRVSVAALKRTDLPSAETTAESVYAAVYTRNAAQKFYKDAAVTTGDTSEDVAVPTDFNISYCALGKRLIGGAVVPYTGPIRATLIYGGALSAAQLATYKSQLDARIPI